MNSPKHSHMVGLLESLQGSEKVSSIGVFLHGSPYHHAYAHLQKNTGTVKGGVGEPMIG